MKKPFIKMVKPSLMTALTKECSFLDQMLIYAFGKQTVKFVSKKVLKTSQIMTGFSIPIHSMILMFITKSAM